MAASMLKNLGLKKSLRFCRISDLHRTFLSDAYKCEHVWKERLKSPYLEKIDPKAFGIQLLENFDETKMLHSVDVDLFVNRMQDLPDKYNYLKKDILHRFRHCNSSVPIQDSIMHAIVRGYMERNELHSLMEMIKDRSKYGVFPDDHSLCLLLDHFITSKDYHNAAQLAYHVMLQEEYENQTLNLLALTAAIKHFCHTMDLERKEQEPEPAPDSDDIEYIPVKVIRNPYYDDHFDIKDERFLLGKTLYCLGKSTPIVDDTVARSLQLIGLGLYEKFELANQLLGKWISDKDLKQVVCIEALDHYSECLNTAPTRDPDAEPRSMGEKTIDDEIELLKLTPDGKSDCLKKLESLKASLGKEKSPSINIEEKVETCLSSKQFQKYQEEDIRKLTESYKQWASVRDKKVSDYLVEKRKQEKEKEIQEKLVLLQEREELLTYFENRYKIEELAKNRASTVEKEEAEEEYVNAPGERSGKFEKKKKKK